MRPFASLILTLAAAVVVGAVMALADKLGYSLVLVMPLVGGAIIGGAAALPAGRRTSRTVLVIIGLLGALLAQGVYWGGQYLNYRETVVSEIIAEYPDTTREEIFAVMDEMETELYGTTGFVAFVQIYAEEGMAITRLGSTTSSGITLQGTVLYIFWVVEAVLMVGMAMVRAAQRKNQPAQDAAPAMA